MNDKTKSILSKLYITGLVILGLVAVGGSTFCIVATIHDHIVRAEAYGCFSKVVDVLPFDEKGTKWVSDELQQKINKDCNVKDIDKDLYADDIWYTDSSLYETPLHEAGSALLGIVISCLPYLILFGLKHWAVWVLK